MNSTEQILTPIDLETYALPAGKVLVLRSCKSDMTAYGGFKWPESGPVETPTKWNDAWGEKTEDDIKLCWDPAPNCGGGLHGWLWAIGDYGLKVKDAKAKYLAVEVDEKDIVQLDGKVKFPKGVVLITGTFRQAYDLVMKWYWIRHAEKMRSVESVENTNTTTGYGAHSSTTGREAHSSTTGDGAHSSTTGREAHSSTTGYGAHSSTTGRGAHSSTTGDGAHSSTTGDEAHSSTTGYGAHSSTTGDGAHSSTTGREAHSSTTGKNSIACCLGAGSRAMCGENGSIILTYWDGKRYRHKIGYSGEDGIEAGNWYRLNSHFEFEVILNS